MRLTPGDGAQYWAPSISPDGSLIAMLCNRSGYDEVWLMAADGSRLTQLTHIGQDVEDFAWAADGKRIVIVGGEQGNDPLYVVNIDDCRTTRLSRPAGNHSAPRWVPGRDAFVIGFDSPSQPPDLYLCAGTPGAGKECALTDSAPPALKSYPFVMPTHIEFTSYDGWLIPGFLYWPSASDEKQNRARGLAAIVYPHGGPNAQYDLAWDPVRQYFVAKGYVILCPNYRARPAMANTLRRATCSVGELAICRTAWRRPMC